METLSRYHMVSKKSQRSRVKESPMITAIKTFILEVAVEALVLSGYSEGCTDEEIIWRASDDGYFLNYNMLNRIYSKYEVSRRHARSGWLYIPVSVPSWKMLCWKLTARPERNTDRATK